MLPFRFPPNESTISTPPENVRKIPLDIALTPYYAQFSRSLCVREYSELDEHGLGSFLKNSLWCMKTGEVCLMIANASELTSDDPKTLVEIWEVEAFENWRLGETKTARLQMRMVEKWKRLYKEFHPIRRGNK